MRILNLLRNRFESCLQDWVADPTNHAQRVALSKDSKHGDYQANLAMGVAKELGQDSLEVAKQVVDRLSHTDICESVEIAGKGFINLRMKDSWIQGQLREVGLSDRLAVESIADPRTYVIDYSSPNVAKPMHVGHIRSTVIGDAIAKTLRFLGHKVISDNHLGDWGTQFGMVIYGYKHFRNDEAFADQPVPELSRLYRLIQQIIGYQDAKSELPQKEKELEQKKVYLAQSLQALAQSPDDKKVAKTLKANERAVAEAEEKRREIAEKIAAFEADTSLLALAQAHPQLSQRVLAETAKLHEGDDENNQLWKAFLPHCIEEIHRVYRRLNVHFDYELGESYYHDMLQKVVDRLVNDGIAVESEGAICVFLDEYDAPMIVRKQDGAFLYATTDLATVDYRMEHFHPDAILYVVDHRQSEHFQKLFAVLRKCGFGQTELKHVSFGTVLGSDGKPFKTRSGSVIGLDYLLDEAVQRAYSVVSKAANDELTEEEKQKISEVVGLGAIKYADLMHNRTSDYEFDLDKMVQLEGNTSTYIQYSYARTSNILRKAEVVATAEWFSSVAIRFAKPIERELALQILRFEDYLHLSLDDYSPSVITAYLYDLAKLFASFYDQCPVLHESDPAIVQSRLGLVYLTGKTIRQGLAILGIDVVERM